MFALLAIGVLWLIQTVCMDWMYSMVKHQELYRCAHKLEHVLESESLEDTILDLEVQFNADKKALGKIIEKCIEVHGITDTAVLMAIKAQVRNDRPVVLALSTNDALGTAAVNIGGLLNRRNLYFVPFSQDDHEKKPRSMAARFGLCEQTMEAAMEGRQAQPIIL